MPRRQPGSSTVTAASQQEVVSEGIENFELPRSLVTKLARSGMSENTKMQKDVVLSYSKASTVFINYLAATAHEVSSSKQHKSISASDVLKALEMVDLGDMLPMLQRELQVYREIQKADKGRKSGGSKGKAREPHSETASASVPASAPSRPNAKGKEKEPKALTVTIASTSSAAQESDPEPEGEGEGVEEEEIDEDMEQEADDDEEMAEDDEVIDEEEGDLQDDPIEELEEPMVVEDEQLQQDEGSVDDNPEDE